MQNLFSSSGRSRRSGDGLHPVRFGDVLRPLRAAIAKGPVWLEDFSNDELLVPADLIEVLHAFAEMNSDRPLDTNGACSQA